MVASKESLLQLLKLLFGKERLFFRWRWRQAGRGVFGVQQGLARRPSEAQPSSLEAPLHLLIWWVLDCIDEELFDFILTAGVVAEFRNGANPQLNDLVFDALLEIELQRKSGEGVLRRSKLLRDGGHDSQQKMAGAANTGEQRWLRKVAESKSGQALQPQSKETASSKWSTAQCQPFFKNSKSFMA